MGPYVLPTHIRGIWRARLLSKSPMYATHMHMGHLESKSALQITHVWYPHAYGPFGEQKRSPNDPCVLPTCVGDIWRAKLLSKSRMCAAHMHMGHLESKRALERGLTHVCAYGSLCATHTHKGHLESEIALQITHVCYTHAMGHLESESVKTLSKSPMCNSHMHMAIWRAKALSK